MLKEGPVDILLLDHKLPDTTGLDILDSLAKRSLDLLTIMITAYASLETAVAATRAALTISSPSRSRLKNCAALSESSSPSHPAATGSTAG